VLAGTLDAQPAPEPLTLLDVPFISQSEALCGGAAAAMVMRYWGERGIDAESFAHLVDRSAEGIRTSALVDDLRARGWNAVGLAGSDERVARELSQGRPVLALIEDRPDTYHYVVIVAATAGAVVFHDPARAPLRVIGRADFDRRWGAAARWMAIVLPRDPPPAPSAAETPPIAAANRCDALVAEGVSRAQANDLAASERSLTMALPCPGSAALRELAGVRLLQRRWPDVTALAEAAVAIEPRDEHAWRLLATSRYVQRDPLAALAAWNRIGEPRVDLVSVAGLVRTRQPVVDRLLGVEREEVLTPDVFTRARRRLDELPSAFSTGLSFTAVPGGLAELRGTIDERPVIPADRWSYTAIGLKALTNRELEISTGSLTGGGERLTGTWRFWPERPQVTFRLDSPAPWGGIWSVDGFASRESFDRDGVTPGQRAGAGLGVADWIGPAVRLAARGGVATWDETGAHATAGTSARVVSRGNRFEATVSADLWRGGATFGLVDGRIAARSSAVQRGRVYLFRGGAAAASVDVPADLWFAGDTGHTRASLLRAHPVLEDGRLLTERLGRRIVHASFEAQQWWTVAVTRVAAAAFLDTARVSGRLDPASRTGVDAGLGARLAIPGVRGAFRVDVAHGLRDGATAISFVYEP
jgi:hypothetical protein